MTQPARVREQPHGARLRQPQNSRRLHPHTTARNLWTSRHPTTPRRLGATRGLTRSAQMLTCQRTAPTRSAPSGDGADGAPRGVAKRRAREGARRVRRWEGAHGNLISGGRVCIRPSNNQTTTPTRSAPSGDGAPRGVAKRRAREGARRVRRREGAPGNLISGGRVCIRPSKNYSGKLPCFFGGRLARLVRKTSSPRARRFRTSCGKMTSSTKPSAAA